MRYVDAHCHIQFPEYDDDRDRIIESMRAEGVYGIVVGCDLESSRKAVALAERHEHLFASVGLHPNRETGEWFAADAYRELLTSPKTVAIGECGLDNFRPQTVDERTKEAQRRLLNDQLRLADEFDKPLIIHARPSKGTQDAYHELIDILKEEKVRRPSLRGDIHFFVGGAPELRELTALGFTVSYTAVLTFARDYDETVRAAPLGSLLTETDAPYVAPKSRRGTRNDPLAIPEIVTAMAEIRGEEREAVRRASVENAVRLFGLPVS